MKVLIGSTIPILTHDRKGSGGWVNVLIKSLSRSSQVSMVFQVSIVGKRFGAWSLTQSENNYQIAAVWWSPIHWKRTISAVNEIIRKNEIDILDVQGCEFWQSYLYTFTDIPTVYTLQGSAQEVSRVFWKDFRYIGRKRVLRHLISWIKIIFQSLDYFLRGRFEYLTLRKGKYFIGRTDWDRRLINPSKKYFHIDRKIQDIFFTDSWVQKKNDSFISILLVQGHYSIKGSFFLLKRLSELASKTGLKIELSIAGRFRQYGYSRLLRDVALKHDFVEVVFLGSLTSTQLLSQYLKASLVVVPSWTENSSNALAEALCVGTPVIASLVGGNANYIDGKSEFLFEHEQPGSFESAVTKALESDKLCQEGLRKYALERFNGTIFMKSYERVYKHILSLENRS